MPERSVIIVGGGLAGLAAAVALTRYGYHVSLHEARPRLGGRAASITDTTTGMLIDNCQHVSMGCCVNFQQLCDWTETSHLFSIEQQLQFIAADGRVNRLKNSGLPAPAHLGWSFANFSYFTWSEKYSLARALLNLVRATPPASGLFVDWLNSQKQSPRLRDQFWDIVLVSALSEALERIDFAHARKVFVDGFLQHREGWKVHLLTIPLGEFYDAHLGTWLTSRGGQLRCLSGVARMLADSAESGKQRLEAVELRDGTIQTADHYILAVPFDRASALLPESVTAVQEFSHLNEIETAPITSVHFWLDRPFTELRHAVLINRLSQWMFNRTAILQPHSSPSKSEQGTGYSYQVVISNSREVRDLLKNESENSSSQQTLIEKVWQELTEIWPDAKMARRLHARVLTEHRAVFSVLPGIEALRPPQQTPLENLQLAGDYTRTGWPATMEGAVRSGFLAAENILKQDGLLKTSLTLLATDLPANSFLTWWSGSFKP